MNDGEEAKEIYNLLLGFIQSAIKLKSLPRQGWIRVGIPLSDVESVADHSYNVAMLSLLLTDLNNALYPERELDPNIVMRIAIIHDLPECQYQDFDHRLKILLGQDTYQTVKTKILTSASNELLSLILNEDVQKQWRAMFDDLRQKNTEEAQFVSFVDKLEVMVQALSYESLGYNYTLFDDFWRSSKEYLESCPYEVINNLIPILMSEREKMKKN